MNDHSETDTPPTAHASCNIDARGRAIRLVGGIITTAIAGALFAGLLTGALAGPVWWAIAVGAIVGGMFQIYEGWAGWCALRAMGVRTPF